jgi:hypothetical protein
MMRSSAPLQVTVQISLGSERCFRLCSSIELPPRLAFARGLPIEGSALGRISFELPDRDRIGARATLRHDPEHPERGSEAELLDLPPRALAAIQSYIAERSLA